MYSLGIYFICAIGLFYSNPEKSQKLMNSNTNLATLNKIIKIKAFGPYKFQQLKKFKWAYKYLKVKGVDIA